MAKFTIEQHQMMEDLTGKQYTRAGTVRKHPRSFWETKRLGLIDREREAQFKIFDLINNIKRMFRESNTPYTSQDIIDVGNKMGHQITKLHIKLAGLKDDAPRSNILDEIRRRKI